MKVYNLISKNFSIKDELFQRESELNEKTLNLIRRKESSKILKNNLGSSLQFKSLIPLKPLKSKSRTLIKRKSLFDRNT